MENVSKKDTYGSALRDYECELHGAVDIFGTNQSFSEMARRVYATPWAPESAPSSDSGSEDSTALMREALEKLKRDLRQEFLEVLKNYAPRDMQSLSQQSIDHTNKQIGFLRRDLQLVMQKQSEMENLVVDLSSIYVGQIVKEQSNEQKRINSESIIDGSVERRYSKDPLLEAFKEFSFALESVSHLIGSSFRHLQQSLHYPEAFKDLATNETYHLSRRLLEFLTSSKANQLIANIETLAGHWRSVGSSTEGDQLDIGATNLRDFRRKPWWTLRPFDYS